MFVTSHDDLAQRARLLRNHGAKPKYHHEAVGGNFRLDELQAAFLRVKRTQLKGWIDRRITNAAQYRKQLENVPGLILPQEASAILGINSLYASKIVNAVMPSPHGSARLV